MPESNFRDIFRRRMARGAPIDDEERQALQSLLAPPIEVEAGTVDPGFTRGESRAALERGRETLRNQSPSFQNAFKRRRPSMEVRPDPTDALSEEEFRRQEIENLRAGRPTWTTHATGYGTGSGRQQLPAAQPTPAGTAITATKGGYPKTELREIPEAQRRVGEPADQTLRRINLKNDIMGNTGVDQMYRDDLSNPALRPEMPEDTTQAGRSQGQTFTPAKSTLSFKQRFRENSRSGSGGDPLAQEPQVREDRVPQHIVDAVMQGQTRSRTATPTAPEELTNAASFKKRFEQARQGYGTAPVDSAAVPPEQKPFGSSGEPFGSTRPRRTEPRDTIADDNQYLRDLERQPRNWKDKTIDVLDAISAGFGNKPRTTQTKRERETAAVKNRLGRDLTVESERSDIASKRASAYDRFNKPPAGSTRIVDEGEYRGVPSGTEIRQVWDPTRREMVDDVRNGRPVVSKSPPAERAAAKEIKYNFNGQAYLVPKDGGPATPIFQDDGRPLTKQANENGNVQTAYRLAPDGITQIQIERDSQTGEWVDSVAPGKRQVVRGRVGRIDPQTGAPMSSLITDDRQRSQEQQESQRKRQSYEGEAQEWGGKETAFRQNKNTEDDAIKAKTAQLQTLYQEQPGGKILNRGGRTQQAIDTDRARLQKELETHRTNSARFQTEADNAAAAATTARRNAGMSGGPQSRGAAQSQGAMGRPPARDGKHHYTRSEIKAAADANGKSFDALYKILKRNRNVVIDE